MLISVCLPCVPVRLVLLDPQQPFHHAEAPSRSEGPGGHEVHHGESAGPRAFLFGSRNSLGPQSIPGQRGLTDSSELVCINLLPTNSLKRCFDLCKSSPAVSRRVSRYVLHWTTGHGSRQDFPQEISWSDQDHQEPKWESESAVLVSVSRPNPQQCGRLREHRWGN